MGSREGPAQPRKTPHILHGGFNGIWRSLARTFLDPRPDFDEYRFLTIGYTTTNRLVIVAHTDRRDRIRIITARDVEPKERRFYEQ